MFKKCIGILTVAGIASAMVFAGCSSTTTNNVVDDGGGTDAKKADTGPATDTGTGDDAGGNCLQSTASFAPKTYKPAETPSAACTPAMITALQTDCDADRGASACTAHATDSVVGATCWACYQTESSAATWGPIVHDASASPPFLMNQAGCINIVSGVAGCGDALITLLDCIDTACPSTACGTDTSTGSPMETCVTDSLAAGGGCDTYKISSTCNTATGTGKPASNKCFAASSSAADEATFFQDLVGVFCNGTATDAGDAG